MGHGEQCHCGPGAPGLAQCLGMGHTRHLEPFHCQETQIQRQQDRLTARENMGVSDDSCQQSQQDEPSDEKNVILYINWKLLRPVVVFQAAEWTSQQTERHNKSHGPSTPNLHSDLSLEDNTFHSGISKVQHYNTKTSLVNRTLVAWNSIHELTNRSL